MRILIFTASTGGGHKRAAAAMREHFVAASKENDVKIIDGLALTGGFYNSFICGGYSILAKKMPRFYGKIYRDSDRHSALNDLCNSTNTSMAKKLVPAINEYQPDVIISCHAFITTMLGFLKTQGSISAPIIALITDFKCHYTYIAEGIDHYIVSSEEMIDDINTRFGIDRSNLHNFGIPVFERFLTSPDKAELDRRLGLREKTKTILFMAGSFGVTEVLKVYKDIYEKAKGCQFVVITGNNKHLYNRFKSVVNSDTKLLMFVDNVEDYMHASDLIITKPGGLTVSESLQCRLPMAIYSAFPGQEADNADFLKRNGVAVLLDKHPGNGIKRLIYDNYKLRTMSENCSKVLSGNTCEKILGLASELTEERN